MFPRCKAPHIAQFRQVTVHGLVLIVDVHICTMVKLAVHPLHGRLDFFGRHMPAIGAVRILRPEHVRIGLQVHASAKQVIPQGWAKVPIPAEL